MAGSRDNDEFVIPANNYYQQVIDQYPLGPLSDSDRSKIETLLQRETSTEDRYQNQYDWLRDPATKKELDKQFVKGYHATQLRYTEHSLFVSKETIRAYKDLLSRRPEPQAIAPQKPEPQNTTPKNTAPKNTAPQKPEPQAIAPEPQNTAPKKEVPPIYNTGAVNVNEYYRYLWCLKHPESDYAKHWLRIWSKNPPKKPSTFSSGGYVHRAILDGIRQFKYGI